MFPSLRYQLEGLEPKAHYCIVLEMTLVDKCRYKYTGTSGWIPAGTEEAHSPHRIYLHPDSPATGETWMSQQLSFSKIKLTNMPNPQFGQLVLNSMHRYEPKIVIFKTNNPRNLTWAPTLSFSFPETQFIAVTAYQNEKITKLKIDHNPFAKGFRDNGQGKTKRKRNLEDSSSDDTLDEAKTIKIDVTADSDEEGSLKSVQSDVFTTAKTTVYANSTKNCFETNKITTQEAFQGTRKEPRQECVYPQVYSNCNPYYPYYSSYLNNCYLLSAKYNQIVYPQYVFPHPIYDCYCNDCNVKLSKYEEPSKPLKTFTDFSIRAITGSS